MVGHDGNRPIRIDLIKGSVFPFIPTVRWFITPRMIRPEKECDHNPIRELTAAAFAASAFGHNGEADLVDGIRKADGAALSLVAEEHTRILGHILFSPLAIHTGAGVVEGMGLGPMSVLPDQQRRGIGSGLIREGLKRLETMNCRFVVVFGHADYYPRFGFVPAADMGITHAFEGMPQEFLFVNVLDPSVRQQIVGGVAIYHSAFGPQPLPPIPPAQATD